MKHIHPIRTIEPTSKRTSTIKSIIDNNKNVKTRWWRQVGVEPPIFQSNPLLASQTIAITRSA